MLVLGSVITTPKMDTDFFVHDKVPGTKTPRMAVWLRWLRSFLLLKNQLSCRVEFLEVFWA